MSETILIAGEDSPQFQATESAIGQMLHYRVVRAGSGEEAAHYIRSGQQPEASVVVFDTEKPGDACIEAIQSIKTLKAQLPMLVLTAYGDDAAAMKAVRAGACDFIVKPMTLERMSLALENALKMYRMSNYIDWLERKVAGHVLDEQAQVKTLKLVQAEAIRFALQCSGGCMTRAARNLGIGRSTLYRKVSELNIDPKTYPPEIYLRQATK